MKMNNNSCYYWNLCLLYYFCVRRFESEEVAIVAATCDSLRNDREPIDTLGHYICERLLEADHISLHLVRYGRLLFR